MEIIAYEVGALRIYPHEAHKIIEKIKGIRYAHVANDSTSTVFLVLTENDNYPYGKIAVLPKSSLTLPVLPENEKYNASFVGITGEQGVGTVYVSVAV